LEVLRARRSSREFVDHLRELRAIIGDQLRRNYKESGPIRKVLEPRVEHIDQPRGKTSVNAKACLGHIADDYLDLRPCHDFADRVPLGIRHERAGDRPNQAGAFDACTTFDAPFHEREQAVLRIERARISVRRTLHRDDTTSESPRSIGCIDRRRAQGAQQHTSAELEDPFRKLSSAVGALRPAVAT
jgi:hypothetical protein